MILNHLNFLMVNWSLGSYFQSYDFLNFYLGV
jgi:hypothetical protein